jgi:serine/threonine-protein kinase PpkA
LLSIKSVYHCALHKKITMHRILVVDDEEVIRKNLERLLTLEGYEVATASNGQLGLATACVMLPDIVVTDVNMPVLDGFGLLDALRAHHELERTIVIMLTAADDRTQVRKGMRLGADDYITKPFKREELLESISAQLHKIKRFDQHKSHAVALAIAQNEEQTKANFRLRYGTPDSVATDTPPNGLATDNYIIASSFVSKPGDSGYIDLTEPPPLQQDLAPTSSVTLQATVMFADIRNFTTMAERLTAAELATLLGRYFELACRPVVAYGGTHLKMLGDGLLALFEGDPSHSDASHSDHSHASRAISAAMALGVVAQEFSVWVTQSYGARGLPDFAVGVGLHSGEVTLGQLGSPEAREVTPLGDTVNIASRLQASGKDLGWTVVTSAQTAHLAGDSVQMGRQQIITIRGREQSVSACEVLGYQASVDLQLDADMTSRAFEDAAVGTAAETNSQITARAAKGALKQSLWSLQSGSFASQPQRFKGYQIIRKLGEGGMSDVFLAYSAAKKSEVALKVLRTALQSDAEMLRRFIQEYAVLANIRHQHIAEIYDQGFTDEYAFIAMEYLSGGSFKDEVAKLHKTLSVAALHHRVIDLLRQIVSALSTIHTLGMVYRDLKPDNLMFRADGALVLVDFGIVKNIREESDALVRTKLGQIIGTPYYVSPEQAAGKEVTHRSDFYSLGVILYELLTGARPYTGDSLGELLAQHIHGKTPLLPVDHVKFQPFLNRMMAKIPEERPADCTAVWRNLEILATP